jgi:hypothetical protein
MHPRLHAGRRWQRSEYIEQGIAVCAALHRWCMNPELGLPSLGDWVGGRSDRTGPLKDRPYCDVGRTSDWCCGHFLLFSQACMCRPCCVQAVYIPVGNQQTKRVAGGSYWL